MYIWRADIFLKGVDRLPEIYILSFFGGGGYRSNHLCLQILLIVLLSSERHLASEGLIWEVIHALS